MAASRFDSREVKLNSQDMYKNVFDNRNVKKIDQYETGHLNYPTVEQIRELSSIQHIWSRGDHYYKLAHKYYGDPSYWWVIAQFNKKPTEDKLPFGSTVFIPVPLELVLEFYGA